MTEAVVTTGAIKRVKLQSNCHHQQTNTQLLHRPDALPVAQPMMSEHSIKISTADLSVIMHRHFENSSSHT